MNIFDTDYLQKVNERRLDDLKGIDHKEEKHKDALEEYLDRETNAAGSTTH